MGSKITRGNSGDCFTCQNHSSKRTGGNQPHTHAANASVKAHVPPYYAMCFIMKIN